jgi:hypothetical protein
MTNLHISVKNIFVCLKLGAEFLSNLLLVYELRHLNAKIRILEYIYDISS